MLLALCKFGNSTARSSTASLRGRLFHACNVDHATSHKDPVKYREILDRQKAAYRLKRLESSVEYRELLERKYASKRFERLEDPIEYRNQKRIENSAYYYGSPENARKYSERNKRPDVREQKREYRQKPAVKQSHSLRRFMFDRPHTWRHLEWKTHTPILYDIKTKHECSTCHKLPYQGLRLWWKRHDNLDQDPDIYDCHACFAADWSRALPIGYEDFVFGQGQMFRLRDRAGSASTAPDSKIDGP